jgi:hypothetical protein
VIREKTEMCKKLNVDKPVEEITTYREKTKTCISNWVKTGRYKYCGIINPQEADDFRERPRRRWSKEMPTRGTLT